MSTPTAPAVRVWCRAESRYGERPTAFLWQERRIEVTQVIAQWREPQHLGFRVLGDDGGIYTLLYDEATETWQAAARG